MRRSALVGVRHRRLGAGSRGAHAAGARLPAATVRARRGARRCRPASARSRWRRRRGSAGARRRTTLPVTAMIGSVLNRSIAADRADRLVAVHDRHHDVHQDDVDVGRPLEDGERLGAALGDDDVGVAALEERGQREDVAEVVVDHEDLRPVDRAVVEPSDRLRSRLGAAGAPIGVRVERRRVDGLRRGVACRASAVVARPAERQVDGEGAALARRARHGDLAAEQADELAADREAEPGAAVEAGGGAVALRERLEDPLLLLARRCRCRCR